MVFRSSKERRTPVRGAIFINFQNALFSVDCINFDPLSNPPLDKLRVYQETNSSPAEMGFKHLLW